MFYRFISTGRRFCATSRSTLRRIIPIWIAFWRICGRRCTRPTGWGSQAPQVGRNIRVFVVDASVNADEDPRLAGFRKTFINARIYERFRRGGALRRGLPEPAPLERGREPAGKDTHPLCGRAFRRTRRGVRRLRGPGDSARVRSPGRQAVRRSSLSVAQDADQGQAGRHGQRQVQGCLQRRSWFASSLLR